MPGSDVITVCLTGPASHRLVMDPGRGSCVIGQGPDADLTVAPDARLDWSAFDHLDTPAGSPWPRWFTYHGDDAGFVAWAQRRPIEGFDWYPSRAHDVDAGAALIGNLLICVPDAPLRLVLPETGLAELGLSGHLEHFAAAGRPPRSLALAVRTSADRCAPPAVPAGVPGLEGVEALRIVHRPLGQPVSLTMLRAFPSLRSVSLRGGFTDFDVLAEFPRLTSIELRFVPRIEGLPPLASFPELTRFIGWNIIDVPGKALRSELRRLGQVRELRHASVSQLRSAEWFEHEYGLPYSGWRAPLAKRAVTAHRTSQAALRACATAQEAERVLSEFVDGFNGMDGIETAEREDLAVAVVQLVTQVGTLISPQRALAVFDEVREF